VARSRQDASARQRKKERKEAAERTRRNRRSLLIAAIAAVLLVSAAVVVAAGNARSARFSDLSSVGQGIPAVVQVHDTTCPVCSELRRNLDRAIRGLDPSDLIVRIADVNTPEGLEFAARYTDARRVTLLYFSADGTLVDTQTGLQDVDGLRANLLSHAQL
jgi:hypothetical protein